MGHYIWTRLASNFATLGSTASGLGVRDTTALWMLIPFMGECGTWTRGKPADQLREAEGGLRRAQLPRGPAGSREVCGQRWDMPAASAGCASSRPRQPLRCRHVAHPEAAASGLTTVGACPASARNRAEMDGLEGLGRQEDHWSAGLGKGGDTVL